MDATRAGYDDYGAELDKDARVWSAYVKEAEQWDDEMVDGWNRYVFDSHHIMLLPEETSFRSLDVILGKI